MHSQQTDTPVTFPIPPGQPRKIDFTLRTLGEFRAMTSRLPDDTLLFSDGAGEYGQRITYGPEFTGDEPPAILFFPY